MTFLQFHDAKKDIFFTIVCCRGNCTLHIFHLNFFFGSSLFPCGDHMVCIIDDREDVWNYAPNLVHVKPYIFFKNTGDINAPPGSAKVPMPPKDSQPAKKPAAAAASSPAATTDKGTIRFFFFTGNYHEDWKFLTLLAKF